MTKYTAEFRKKLERVITIISGSKIIIDKIYMFGSFAYGTPHEYSDIDLLIIVSDEMGNLFRMIDIMNIMQTNIWDAGIDSVDLIVETSSHFEKRCKMPTIENTIFEKGMVIYDKGKYVGV